MLPTLALMCGLLAAADARAEIPYTVEIVRTDGTADSLLADDPLLSALRQASELVTLVDRTPRARATLDSRVDTDRDRLARVLRAEGYYDGTVTIAVDDTPSPQADGAETAARRANVTINVTPGARYTLRSFTIDNAHPYGAPFPLAVALNEIGVALGDPGSGRDIVAGQDRLIELLADRGRPFAEVVDRLVIADHDADAVDVTLTVDAGPEAVFGAVEIEGLDEVEAALIRQRLAWREGEVYDQAQVDQTRASLAQLNVFSAVTIAPAVDWVGPDDALPMRIQVTERDHRTIGGGVSYSTTDGFGGRAYWRHRNLFGQAERLELRLAATQRLAELAAEYRDNSLFVDPRYTLTAATIFDRERRPGYTRLSAEAAAGVEYAMNDELTLSAGVRVAQRDIDEEERGKSRFTLLGVPGAIDYDLRDDGFNPTNGGLTSLTLEPLLLAPDPSFVALRATLRQTGYWAPLADDSIVLAAWGEIGGLIGADRDTIPADERFYVGGGGSVRGFGYQFAGDLDDDGDPLGGQSMAALGVEARFRFLDDYGAVLFVEGGRSYADAIPRFGEPLFWGAGVGARYFTDFGPLRLDVAVPLNGRSGADDGFQIYLSFGQAF